MIDIRQNLSHIQARIAQAAQKAGRQPEEITLVAVSKTKPMDLIQEAWAAGQTVFGENRVQEMSSKQPECPDADWHLIGGLQRNKVKYLAPFVSLIHSLDNEKLMAEINKRAAQHERSISCLIQLNISDEDQKNGVDEAGALALIQRLDTYPNVEIKGFMGMAAFTDDADLIRSQFRHMREVAGRLSAHQHPRFSAQELSMGMSGDFEIAIEEGSTMVRIGSSIFGKR